jgi:hypothetical protein
VEKIAYEYFRMAAAAQHYNDAALYVVNTSGGGPGNLLRYVQNTRGNKEDQAELDTLLAQMRNVYAPVGIAEDLLVQEIAISYWRSARALRCERGDVTCAGAERKQYEISEMDIRLLMVQPAADAYHSLLRSSGGIKLQQNRTGARRSRSLRFFVD